MGATIWNQWSFNSQVGIPQIEQSSNLVHYSKKKRAHFEKKKMVVQFLNFQVAGRVARLILNLVPFEPP